MPLYVEIVDEILGIYLLGDTTLFQYISASAQAP
jgi:hypothetical protein